MKENTIWFKNTEELLSYVRNKDNETKLKEVEAETKEVEAETKEKPKTNRKKATKKVKNDEDIQAD